MQQFHQGAEIAEQIVRLSAMRTAGTASPNVESLGGGKDRTPELRIASKRRGVAYLNPRATGTQRRWTLGGVGDVNVTLAPGEYDIYLEMVAEDGGNLVRRSQINVESNKVYRFGEQ